MRVYLVRHGQTAWNAEGRNQGHTDIPLDADGLEQARRLADAFDDRPFARVYTSDLKRARATAEPLAQRHGAPVHVRTELRERCFGEWEGLHMERVAQNFLEQAQLQRVAREEVCPPGGESTVDVWRRIELFVAELQAATEPVVVVCHGGTGAVLLARLIQGTAATARALRLDNTGITTVRRHPEGVFQLAGYNETTHLRTAALSGSVDGTFR